MHSRPIGEGSPNDPDRKCHQAAPEGGTAQQPRTVTHQVPPKRTRGPVAAGMHLTNIFFQVRANQTEHPTVYDSLYLKFTDPESSAVLPWAQVCLQTEWEQDVGCSQAGLQMALIDL